MPRVLNTVHLSDFQKKVMAIIQASPTPQVAFEEVSRQPQNEQNNINGARDTLEQLGLIEIGPNDLQITDKGTEVMKDENLVDEMGELTQDAQALLGQDDEMDPEGGMDMPPQEDEMGGMDAEGGMPFESIDLLRQIHDMSKFLKS